jgi:serine/threonine protein kinase/WD40 repeat protein
MLHKGDEPVPGYRLEEFLGRGAFGEVWRATSPGRASVALKFLNLSERQGIKEFRAVQRLKSVRHPHLTSTMALWLLDEQGNVLGDDVLDSYAAGEPAPRATLMPMSSAATGQAPQRLVVATLLCDKNLSDRLEECKQQGMSGIPCEELLRYMEEAAKGIDFLNTASHDLGEGPVAIQHCDIKPANIMLTSDCVMICDFGLARFLTDAKTAATGTSMAGSPAYMAPECVKGKPSATSDQYSLAVTYTELRTGRLPFYSESWMDVIEAHCSGNLDLSGLTPNEREVIHKAVSVKPEDRYPSTVAMVRALRRAVEQKEIAIARPSPWRKTAVLITAVVVVASLVWCGFQWKNSRVSTPKNSAGTSATVSEETVTFQVVPADAEVFVDGARVAADASGHVTLKRRGDAQLDILVRKSPEYRDAKRKVLVKQSSSNTLVISLERDADQLRRIAQTDATRAFEIVDGDSPDLSQLEVAVKLYQHAMQLDASRFAMIPPPVRRLNEAEEEYNFTVRCMALNPNRPWLAARVEGRKIALWNLDDLNRPRVLLHEHTDHICNVAMAGQYVASADIADHIRLTLLDENGAATKTIEPASLQGTELAVTPDLKWLVAGGYDGNVRAFPLGSASSDAEARTLGRHNVSVRGIVITPDSRWAFSIGDDGSIKKWDLLLPDAAAIDVPLGSPVGDVSAMCVSPDGKLIAIGGGAEANAEYRVHLIQSDRATARPLPQGHAAEIYAVVFDPITRPAKSSFPTLASGSAAGDVQVWQGEEGPPLLLNGRHAGAIRSLVFSRPAGWLCSGGEDGNVGLWNLNHAQRKPTMLAGHAGRVVQVLVTAKSVIAATSNGTILLWDLRRCILVKEACDEMGIEPKATDGGRSVIST